MSGAAPVRDHCLAPSRSLDPAGGPGARYGRLFPTLPPLSVEEDALLALGVVGGVCDGDTACVDARGASGWPLFGQFVAHDITADRSPLAMKADPDGLRNFHAPRANLEPLYGGGPAGEPYLYSRKDPAKLLLGRRHDHPRNPEGIALFATTKSENLRANVRCFSTAPTSADTMSAFAEFAREAASAPPAA